MEGNLLKGLRNLLENLVCSQTQPNSPLGRTMSTASQDTSMDIKLTPSDTDEISPMGSISEGIPAQAPHTSAIPKLNSLFHLKNVNTGEQLNLDDKEESFVERMSLLLQKEDYPQALSEFNKQKRRMNDALWQAVRQNESELCKLLLDKQHYGDLVAEASYEKEGFCPMHLAASLGFNKVCEVLLDYGEIADLNQRDHEQRTALHLACFGGHLSVAQLLVRSGAHLNATDKENNTPLHYAIQNGNHELVKWILGRFPDLEITNSEGKTPLEMNNRESIAEIISSRVIPPPAVDMTPRRVQIHKSNQDALNMMLQPTKEATQTSEESKKITPVDFQALTQLGKGSFGEVYLVEKRGTNELYAMKVLHKNKIMGQNLVKYAMTERNVLSYIKHPFIVGLNFAFQTSDRLFLILDYCPGGDLGSLLSQEKRLSETIARIYTCEITCAIEELHKRDIIFRDLKPDNVVLDSEGHAMLTDFGLSKEGVTDNSKAQSFCGSVAYLAPEILKRKGHGKAVDWYLLGVLLYEMLVGQPPYYSHNRDELFMNIQRGKLRIPSCLSANVKSLLKALLQRDPSKRLGSRADAEEIKEHPFFYGINWDGVLRREMRPPKPKLKTLPGPGVPQEKVLGRESTFDSQFSKVTGWTFVSE